MKKYEADKTKILDCLGSLVCQTKHKGVAYCKLFIMASAAVQIVDNEEAVAQAKFLKEEYLELIASEELDLNIACVRNIKRSVSNILEIE